MNRLSQFLILVAGSFATAFLIAFVLGSQIAGAAAWFLFFALVVVSFVWLAIFTTRKARSHLFGVSHSESVPHEHGEEASENTNPDALTTLRRRYARGELTDEQFERKLDRLLETDTPEHAAEWRERTDEQVREQSPE